MIGEKLTILEIQNFTFEITKIRLVIVGVLDGGGRWGPFTLCPRACKQVQPFCRMIWEAPFKTQNAASAFSRHKALPEWLPALPLPFVYSGTAFCSTSTSQFCSSLKKKKEAHGETSTSEEQPHLARPRCSAYQAVILSSHISGVI